MPKEYINYPAPTEVLEGEPGKQTGRIELPATPQVGIHWDGPSEYVALSFTVNIDPMREYVALYDAGQRGDELAGESRVRFYTEALTRPELQSLIRSTRRARDAVFGNDE